MANPDYSQASDGLRRTEFFGPNELPTIPGFYECSTGSGYVFKRMWDGANWISPVNGQVTTVRMPWRGVEPESIEIGSYSSTLRIALRDDCEVRKTIPCPTSAILAPATPEAPEQTAVH